MAEKETGRIEAFSDGVFAVAITLLVLDLHVPDTAKSWHRATSGTGPAESCLEHQWPALIAYVVSFSDHSRHVDEPSPSVRADPA